MNSRMETSSNRDQKRTPYWLGICVLAASAVFLLWEDHESHFMQALPYALLLACPVLHLLMHRGHGAHRHGAGSHDSEAGR